MATASLARARVAAPTTRRVAPARGAVRVFAKGDGSRVDRSSKSDVM